MNKYQYSTNTIFYQTARFFRKNGTNEAAYCIEPFLIFNGNVSYQSTTTPTRYTNEQIQKMGKIAYFGYGYNNHTDPKWYAITQLMIWKEAEKYNGDFYFTDYLNGNRKNIFTDEINEIEYLINENNKQSILNNKVYTIVEGEKLLLEDNTINLLSYKTDNQELKINEHSIEIDNLTEGEYLFTLYKNNNHYNKPIIYYENASSQNLLTAGDIPSNEIKIKVNVKKTKIEVEKVDSDNETTSPQGEAQLDGAKYEILDDCQNKIAEGIIKDNKFSVENIPFGKYYIKEVEPGVGYTLDTDTYEIEINIEKPQNKIVLKNKVIEKEIKLHKVYIDDEITYNEDNVSFDIKNKDNIVIKSVTTDESGNATFKLPYGKYTVTQLNTKDGYLKVKDFLIDIKNSNLETYQLQDLKAIKVPNTNTSIINKEIIVLLLTIIVILKNLL